MLLVGQYAMGEGNEKNWYPANMDPNGEKVPSDLIQHYKKVKDGYAYVCPYCKYIFEPGWGGMPEAFRIHLGHDIDENKKVHANCPEHERELKRKARDKGTLSGFKTTK